MTLKVYVNIRFGHFLCVWLSLLWYVNQFIYLMPLVGFKSIDQTSFNQKIYLGKNLAIKVVYFCNGHVSLQRERIFTWMAIYYNY